MKTDVFEEAFGEDALMPSLASLADSWIGIDVAAHTVSGARARTKLPAAHLLVCDVRHLPLCSASLDAIVSNSTLDHFDTRREFESAIAELARVLHPGGRLLITVDNPHNLFYVPLRWIGRLRQSPFQLGYTPSLARLQEILERAGLRVIATSSLIHNPRGFSTMLFLMLRRLAGGRADGIVQWFLDVFARFERLPTREFTACFIAACAVRREIEPLREVTKGRLANRKGPADPWQSPPYTRETTPTKGWAADPERFWMKQSLHHRQLADSASATHPRLPYFIAAGHPSLHHSVAAIQSNGWLTASECSQ
jgi:SAM-dependent methyltransferase